MDERAAGEVLLLRAFEATGFARWTDEDRAGATRSALRAVGADASADAFLAARAQAGLRRLEPLDPCLPAWRALPTWHGAWGALLTGALGLALGLLVDRIGSAQRINLLAPPVWLLIVWNLAVYAALLLRRVLPSAPRAGPQHALLGLWRRWRLRGTPAEGHSAAAWSRFAADWTACSLPLNHARVAALLHLGAAALGLGVLAGMYLRGLVHDYRVGWESTFLSAETAHAVLSTLLAPALALSGQTLPDVATLQALRLSPAASPAVAAASAAPWIHLYALQLGMLVVLPRLLLAWAAGRRARALRRQLPLPLAEPYFQQLLRQQRGSHTPVRVWPHARTPDPAAQATLRTLCARVFGDAVTLRFVPSVAYGAEDEPPETAADGAWRIALFYLGATPEAENQGRLLRALALPGATPVLSLVDEAAFVQRFGAASPRRHERRQVWEALAAGAGSVAVFVELRADGLAAAEAALQAALGRLPGRSP